jgi:RHS repeat-associated protein
MGGQWTDLIYGPTGMLAEVAGTQTATPAFRLLDHLGNEVGTLGSNGLLANPLDYTPFGQIFSGTTNDPYLFTGKERDAESGNDYFGARYFTSTVGRFLSPDWSAKADPVPYTKLDDPQSLNLYAYVHNNPLSGVDADGHGYEGASGHEYYRGPGSDENWRQNANGVFANEKKTATDKQAKQNKLGYDTIDTSQTPRPNVAISWKLKNKSASGGWVVQHITKMNGGKETSNFWEAWQVNPGQNHTIYHPNHFPLNIDDLFANNPSGTHVDATARFYEGLSLPDSFIPGNPATSAGELRSTTQDPHLSLDSATNEVHRTWDAH